MTRRGMWASVGLAACAAILTFAVVLLVRGQQGGQGWKEFTIRRVERSTSLLSGSTLERTVIEAQRADGSRVVAQLAGQGAPTAFVSRDITFVPSRRTVFADDGFAAKVTHYELSSLPYRAPTPDPRCGLARITPKVKPLLKGEDEVIGFKTVVIQTESSPYLTTVWKAPDLDCATLKMTEDKADESGSLSSRFDLSAVSVTVGSPDPALFEVPAFYSEKSPMEMEKARAARKGRAVPEKVLKSLERRERMYLENHRQAAALGRFAP